MVDFLRKPRAAWKLVQVQCDSYSLIFLCLLNNRFLFPLPIAQEWTRCFLLTRPVIRSLPILPYFFLLIPEFLITWGLCSCFLLSSE